MSGKNKSNENRPEQQDPGKAQVPDIRRDDTDLLHRNTNTPEIKKSSKDSAAIKEGDNDRRNDEPVEENTIRS